jgi:excinuclease ABC subunit B
MAEQKVREILVLDAVTRKTLERTEDAWIFPAKHFVTDKSGLERALRDIRAELKERLAFFEKNGKPLEAERLERRTRFDLEMIQQIGYCHGIENYSRPLSGRPPGSPPETLIDYFKRAYGDKWLLVIDESHVTVPQISGMYEGDRARKLNLIEYGFRLPSAADNRPLTFGEFQKTMPQTIYVSATPGPFEHKRADAVVEMVIRPTGLVDPEIIIAPVTARKVLPRQARNESAPTLSQVDDLIERIPAVVARKERVMVTTLTKKMAEDLTEYLTDEKKVRAVYLHSGVETLDRIRILTDFRKGTFDVLVGVNLLREGLDLPEVSLVAILDADKEGFLRSETSIIQTVGRTARNVNGEVILYADTMTESMRRAIAETERRRTIQLEYNAKHGITPKTIAKEIRRGIEEIIRARSVEAEAVRMSERQLTTSEVIAELEAQMHAAAEKLEFEAAAALRDEIQRLTGGEAKGALAIGSAKRMRRRR